MELENIMHVFLGELSGPSAELLIRFYTSKEERKHYTILTHGDTDTVVALITGQDMIRKLRRQYIDTCKSCIVPFLLSQFFLFAHTHHTIFRIYACKMMYCIYVITIAFFLKLAFNYLKIKHM